MQSGWRIGSIFGIPLYLDSSWFFILALFTLGYGSAWQSEGWGTLTTWAAGFVMTLLLFGSVLLHELGHSLIALSQGINVTSITLFLFGGVASIDQESKTPGKAFQVAIAGPAVSFGLFIILTLAYQFLPFSSLGAEIVKNLANINLILSLFNMIPGLPLDGGQVLKAGIWKATGSRLKGIRWAARVGQILGWAAIIIGIGLYLVYFSLGLLWISLLGWFGVRNASAYQRVADLQDAISQVEAADAMTQDFRVIDADLTLEEFADRYIIGDDKFSTYFAASEGRYRGLVQDTALQTIERSQWKHDSLTRIIQPLSDIPSVDESTSLREVIDQLETKELRQITVLSPAGAVAGLIDRGDIVRAIAKKMNVSISDNLIKRIKEDGAYPSELPLHELAKASL
ncbi:MAG: site-2 protease family protein [Elainellaceae cyanobacterium]